MSKLSVKKRYDDDHDLSIVSLRNEFDDSVAQIYCGKTSAFFSNYELEKAERCAELLKQIMIAVKEDASVELVIVPKQSFIEAAEKRAGEKFIEAAEKRAMEVGRQMSESVAGLLTGTGELDPVPSMADLERFAAGLDKKELFYACIELRKVLTGYSPEATFDFTKKLRNLCYGKDEE